MTPISINAISRPRTKSSPRTKGYASGKKCKPADGMISSLLRPQRHASQGPTRRRESSQLSAGCHSRQRGHAEDSYRYAAASNVSPSLGLLLSRRRTGAENAGERILTKGFLVQQGLRQMVEQLTRV